MKEFQSDPSGLLSLLYTKSVTLPVTAKLDETIDNFNDMGFMQAIDLLTALEAVQIILKENNLVFNEKKVIGYGHSHGAYLLHLSNRLAPHMFSYIVDNSAWIEPVYQSGNRYLFQGYGSMTLQTEFDYLAKRIIDDKKALNLSTYIKTSRKLHRLLLFRVPMTI
ncbi:DUF2920 family protein [Sporosarcina sp. 179-K 3D1 HS]|uniref:DUF2920 family protein n=1 Tax=Sporosarcina sp. 179-K 3D1 HS TaxID=3232169 RepID=UPI0039A25112